MAPRNYYNQIEDDPVSGDRFVVPHNREFPPPNYVPLIIMGIFIYRKFFM